MPKAEKRESFGEYVKRVMVENGQSQVDVEQRGKGEAEARGLSRTHKCSDSTIGLITQDSHGNIGMFTLMTLAWGLSRPIEEVVGAAFGFSSQEKNIGELARLAELYNSIDSTEDKKYYRRQLEAITRDMQLGKKQSR